MTQLRLNKECQGTSELNENKMLFFASTVYVTLLFSRVLVNKIRKIDIENKMI